MYLKTIKYKKRKYDLRTQYDWSLIKNDPVKLTWVKPKQIKYISGDIKSGPNTRHLDYLDWFRKPNGGVVGGQWDQNCDKFEDLEMYSGMRERYVEGLPWKDTDFYHDHLDRIKDRGVSLSCSSEKELKSHFNKVDDLYTGIKQNGYLTQKELKNRVGPEIRVNIGRDGELLYNNEGRHRLCIAKILDVNEVPVRVWVRHPEWIQKQVALE